MIEQPRPRCRTACSQLSEPWLSPRRGSGQREHCARVTRTWMHCALPSDSGQDQILADSALPLARGREAGALPGVGEKQKPIRLAGPTFISGGKSVKGRRGLHPQTSPVPTGQGLPAHCAAMGTVARPSRNSVNHDSPMQ
jgi:hypothetical protein